ncbi:hypothetical protein SNEBB_005851 [Seison nebaliae]|nr:hypothetical protein SNEBB_005851 [Seison nebaliae]
MNQLQKREEIAIKGFPGIWSKEPERPDDQTLNDRGIDKTKLDQERRREERRKRKREQSAKNEKRKQEFMERLNERIIGKKKAKEDDRNDDEDNNEGKLIKLINSILSRLDGSTSNSNSSVENDDINALTYCRLLSDSDNSDDEGNVNDFSSKKKEKVADVTIGPTLSDCLPDESNKLYRLNYGKDLLPGEGEAMAKYVKDGKRIPRRGEIGLTSNEIEKFEVLGYVMSGSRHRRMEAVRLRKESQIYSADEKRILLRFSTDARAHRETQILGQFKEMIKRRQINNLVP